DAGDLLGTAGPGGVAGDGGHRPGGPVAVDAGGAVVQRVHDTCTFPDLAGDRGRPAWAPAPPAASGATGYRPVKQPRQKDSESRPVAASMASADRKCRLSAPTAARMSSICRWDAISWLRSAVSTP